MKYLFVACVILFFSCKGDQTKQAELELEKAKIELELEKTKLQREQLKVGSNDTEVPQKEVSRSEPISAPEEVKAKPQEVQTYTREELKELKDNAKEAIVENSQQSTEEGDSFRELEKKYGNQKLLLFKGMPENRYDLYIDQVDDIKLGTYFSRNDDSEKLEINLYAKTIKNPDEFSNGGMARFIIKPLQQVQEYENAHEITVWNQNYTEDNTYVLYLENNKWHLIEIISDAPKHLLRRRTFERNNKSAALKKILAFHVSQTWYVFAQTTEQGRDERAKWYKVCTRNDVWK